MSKRASAGFPAVSAAAFCVLFAGGAIGAAPGAVSPAGVPFSEPFFERLVRLGKFCSARQRRLLRLRQQRSLCMQRQPRPRLVGNAFGLRQLDRCRRSGRCAYQRAGALRGRCLVLIEQTLNRGLLVAPGADQVLAGVLEVVLIERELGLRDPDEVLQLILGAAFRLGEHRRELRDAVLVRGHASFSLLDPRGEFACLRSEGRGIFRRVLHRGGKREIDRMIGETQGLQRVVLLGVRDGELRELLRRLQRPHVHRVRGVSGGRAQGAHPLVVIGPVARENHRSQRQHQQRQQPGQYLLFVTLDERRPTGIMAPP